MIVELGHFALITALLVSIIQGGLGLFGARQNNDYLMGVSLKATHIQCFLLLLSFSALVYAFCRSDFSVLLVASNSHMNKPLIYKIAGTWGNHEGSMLLWVLMLGIYGTAFAVLSSKVILAFRARVIGIHGFMSSTFLGFILFTSNPFERLLPAPYEGNGLNPILQDPALAAHPPLLYAGYVGFSITFAFAVAAMLDSKINHQWAVLVRRWVLVSWVFLTLGIGLGSFWAYYELGWGGFWFWDPVENASLMPWLAGTALLHSVMVTARNGQFMRWTLLLAILTYALSLIGTFLVRSGVLTSVHAFANDPERGIYILFIIVVSIGAALAVYARAMRQEMPGVQANLMGRESFLMLNNVFLATATTTVFIGTLYPLLVDALGFGKISVGAPYYAAVLMPICVPFFMLLPFGPFLSWQKTKASKFVKPLLGAVVLSALSVAAFWQIRPSLGVPVAFALLGSFWLIFGALAAPVGRARLFSTGGLSRLFKLPRPLYAATLAHAGIGVMLLGIIGTTAWREELVVAANEGEQMSIGDYRLVFEGVSIHEGPNYLAERGALKFLSGAREGDRLYPEKRVYQAERSQTTEAAIDVSLMRHVYAALGETLDDNRRVIRIWLHPLVVLIWLGGLMMALGGMVGLSARRLR